MKGMRSRCFAKRLFPPDTGRARYAGREFFQKKSRGQEDAEWTADIYY